MSADNDIDPFDSPVSNKVIGYMTISEIRPVPVWGVSPLRLVEPVRKNSPKASGRSSHSMRTAPQTFGASCHSSNRIGFGLSKKSFGETSATAK